MIYIADGVGDPILLWRTSHQEIWWSKKRLEEIGLEYVDYPEDAHGQIRCVPEQELFFQDSFAEDDVLWANRSKSIRLHAWGWEGSLEDAFDTQSAAVMSLHDGFWQPWHDLDQQLYYRQRCRFKAAISAITVARRATARACIGLSNASVHERIAAAQELRRECPRGDLAAGYWLHKARRSLLARRRVASSSLSSSSLSSSSLSTLDADEESAELNATTLHLHVSHADALGLARGMRV
jgi:hypothetical protein